MEFRKFTTELPPVTFESKLKLNQGYIWLFHPIENEKYPEISVRRFKNIITISVITNHKNSFQKMFHGLMLNVSNRLVIYGIITWPFPTLVFFITILCFLAYNSFVLNILGTVISATILGMFAIIWTICLFIDRTNKDKIYSYLTWLCKEA